MSEPEEEPYAPLLQRLAPQVLGAIIRRYRDFVHSEDAVQEALLAAATQWPREGVPENPRGWLIHVAARRMADIVRSESARRRRETNAAAPLDYAAPVRFPEPSTPASESEDDTLALLFMCCHPALTPSSAIGLTLRAVGGLTTAEIARAFLVPEATMAQRIGRAKKSIKSSGVPFRVPEAGERVERLRAVLHILYLMFNEGYISSSGPHVQRPKLAREAIRLTRSLHGLLPDDSEAAGLLALMLLTDARHAARTGPDGELVPLPAQDRKLWDAREIAEGISLLTATLANGSLGPYQIQAAIAAVHDEAPRHEDTDWPQINALYELLERFSQNPVVTLNRAVALAMVQGAAAGLELLNTLDSDSRLKGNYRLHSVRAHLLEMAGDHQAAVAQYRMAAGRTTSLPERNYLFTQAARLAESAVAQLTVAISEEKAHREKLSHELEIAREVQQHLFPREFPPVPGIDCHGLCRPALEVGGDYYDFLPLAGGNRIGIAIGDIAGKGISAALMMAGLQAAIRAETVRDADDVSEIVARVNRQLCATTTSNRYATLFYAQLDGETKTLRYVNAGHNPPLLFRGADKTTTGILRLSEGGPVIGLSEQFAWQSASVELHRGDTLVAFTDGITEAMNPAGNEWSEENFVTAIESHLAAPAAECVAAVFKAAEAFTSGAPQHDDMTLVVLRVV